MLSFESLDLHISMYFPKVTEVDSSIMAEQNRTVCLRLMVDQEDQKVEIVAVP